MRPALVAATALLLACSDSSTPSPPTPSPPLAAGLTADGRLRLTRQAASKPWLLRTVYAAGNGLSDTNPLRSRVVRFRDEGGGRWTLRDATDAASPSAPPDGPSLGSFTAEESSDSITLDLASGLDRVVVEFGVHEWWKEPKASTLAARDPKPLAARREGDTILLRRQATVELPGSGPVALRFDHALQPYPIAGAFEPRPNNAAQGFYVNAPVPTPEGPAMFAHRHHEAATITYHLPASMPPERVADARAALGYWNDAFERLGLPTRLADAPLAPDADPLLSGKHVIEFRDGAADGAGRAINQTDPLTGQILQSTVMVTGVFALQGADVAQARWGRTRLDAGLPAAPLPPAVLERVVSDYYIQTFAHEIGHGLGLRHNFAGSLASTLDAEGWFDAFDAYLAGDLPPGASFTSSVMEYLETPYAILVGAHLRLRRGPLPHDVETLRSVYAGAAQAKLGLACEQEVAPIFADCAEFDLGPDPLLGAYHQWEDLLAERAFRLARGVAAGQGPGDASEQALILADPLLRLSRLLDKEAHLLAVLARYPAELSEADLAAYRADVLAQQKQSFQGVSGPRAWFVRACVEQGKAPPEQLDKLVAEFRSLTEAYLGKLGAAPDAALSEYFDALRPALGAALEPMAQHTFACVTCAP